MRQSVKRTVSGSRTTPIGLPSLDDHQLATRVAFLPLEQDAHTRATLLLAGLVPGKFGLLKRADRDWLTQIAIKAGAMPKFQRKPKQAEMHMCADAYSSKETRGTLAAQAHLAKYARPNGEMPKPPGRR